MEVESSKIFKKIKKVSKFQKCPKSSPKVSKRKFSKSKKISNSKHAQNRYQKCSNVFWSCFRVIFPRKFSAQCSMEGRVFEKFQKNQKSFKILKMPKIVPKKSKQKFSKSKIFSKFQKSPKSFPKLSKRVLNMFWGDFLEKIFCPVFHGGSDLRKFSKKSKKFQNSKKAQNRSQKCPNVFWSCFRVILSKKLFAQCSMEGRVFENFQKNQKSFKIPKMPKIVPKKVQTKIFKFKKIFKIPKKPKIVPKSVQTCFEDVLGWFFRNFLPSVPWRVRSSKIFKKIQKISKFQKSSKSFPKVSKRVLKLF